MKLTLILCTLLTFINSKDACVKLKDGVYQTKQTTQSISSYSNLTISGDTFSIQVNDILKVNGKVRWVTDCLFKLEPDAKEQQDSTDLFTKLKQSFGDPVIEIMSTKADTTFFRTTYSGNLHITIDEGYFVRQR